MAAAALTTALGAARRASAQAVLGGGDDATLPAPGQVRARATPTFTSYGSTFASGTRAGFGSAFSTDSFGPAQLPRLQAARDTLRAVTGIGGLPLSLGRVQVSGYAQTLNIPIGLEVGVTHRLALGLLVPITRTRTSIAPTVNPGGKDGNFGLNPANARFTDPTTAATANAANGRTQATLAAAVTALGNAGAKALADSVQRFATAMASVYGDGTNPGANAVPLVGSAAQAAVAQRLAQLAASAQADGVTIDATAVPYPAQARIGLSGYRTAVADSSFGVAASDSLGGGIRGYGIGDVELTAMYQWLNTFGDARDARGMARARTAGGRRIRSTIVAGLRLGTGTSADPGRLLDTPPATGAYAFLLRSITDVVFNPHLSVSGAMRVVAPLADTRLLRIPASFDSGYVPLYRERDVGRQLGREVQLELNPRYATGEAFAIWGQALIRDRAADRYTGQYTATSAETGGAPVTFDASPLGIGTAQREARVGLGLSYSTMTAWSRGRSRLPVELSYLHAVTAAGSGGTQPRLSSDVISLRVYAGLRGR
ncbi:MAG TPA: hypothetical protein VGD56_12335 [Gemmatirosa sp.]